MYHIWQHWDHPVSEADDCFAFPLVFDMYFLKEKRLRWYGHVERSNGAVKTAFYIQVEGKRGPGRPDDMEAAD